MDGWAVGADGRPGDLWWACLEAATAAPSVHNTQPWRFAVAGRYVDVLSDASRRLDVLDPSGREMLISVGAAVLNLRVAILAHRRTPVARLLPDPARPEVAARIALGAPRHAPASAVMLARAIPRRRTNRRPFLSIPVAEGALIDLRSAARAEGGTLDVVDDAARDTVLDLVRAADRRWRRDPAYWREMDAWTRGGGDRADGVPPEAFGPWDALETLPIRDFGLTARTVRRRTARYEAEPVLAILATPGDTPSDWLRAGLALERVLLTATVHGLATTLMTQPLELPDLRARLGTSVGARFPQAVVRIGYGPPSAPTPRRPVSELIETALVH